ncbi:UNVERIFIED_CONTAM: hypothetical protein IGO34_35240, partial [Salmonella enterica subsp. enterica serovar Weltevreden]
LERLISKVAAGKSNPRELVQLKRARNIIENVKELIAPCDNHSLQKIAEQLNPCTLMRDRLQNELNEEAPVLLNKGNVISKG